MKWLVPALLMLALAFMPGPAGADALRSFQPSYDIVSISNPSPGAHGNVVQHIVVAAADHPIGSLTFALPTGWDIARAQSNDDEPIVGSGELRADVDLTGTGGPACDSVMEVYPLIIVDQGDYLFDPPEVETNWVVQGYPFQQIHLPVTTGAGGQSVGGTTFNVGPQVCAMTTLDLTFQGISSDNPGTPEGEAGRTVLTNPGSTGVYQWSVEFKSYPLGDPAVHIVTRCDGIGIGATATDTDGDGIADGCDNCPTTANATQLNWDGDSTGDACDPDVDGDGVANGSDQCAFTPLGAPHDVNGCSQAQVDQDLDGICDPGMSSPSLCTGSDNCPTTSNANQANVVHPATTPGDACEDPDEDFWVDNVDNCASTYNPFQEDGELDGFGDICDPCPLDPDCDNDYVSDGPADPDGGGQIVAGPDNCLMTPNTNQLNQDSDSLGNACDNCPTVTNADQLNIDGDAFGDACDAGDFDLDGFSDQIEYFAGTNLGAKCGVDAWPADITNDGFSDISDITFLTNTFGQAVPPAPARYNIAPDPVDGFVDITDITRMTGLFGTPCPP